MQKFDLVSPFAPTGDQPQAIDKLLAGLRAGAKEQVLLGVTGSGKTFTMANVVAALQRPTLVISHNKTLAAQLYQEFREFFPNNAISYFVSYYDYYMPESYIPQTDTYIEKETEINEEIDKLRLAATTNLLTRPDTLVVASVSCIYNIGSPKEYGHFVLELRQGMQILRESILTRLVDLQYERNNYGFHRGAFRVHGDTIDLFPAYEDTGIRMVVANNKLDQLVKFDPLTGKTIEKLDATMIYPAKHYMTDPMRYKGVFEQIRSDLAERIAYFKKSGKPIEAQRIEQRVNFDLEMIAEMGFVNGIENYSRYFDGRAPGDPPYTLLDYFDEATKLGTRPGLEAKNWLLIIDESHMSLPQIRGMYQGDRSRKQTLIDYGFRLPAALDNRPLRFDEFLRHMPQTIYVSATPDEWEVSRACHSGLDPESIRKNERTGSRLEGRDDTNTGVVEQLIRPTGLLDPKVTIKPTQGQIEDLMREIETRVSKKQRVLVTTLTKRMAEDLAKFLADRGIKVHYLHSDIVTLERTDILADLRGGTYDVMVGINLLREGLDLPEVSLVAILDADKEGFLRSRVSLIQTMGRAARHVSGEVIMYADRVTDSMKNAIAEVERRRAVQVAYNKKHVITPRSIQKPIRRKLVEESEEEGKPLEIDSMTPQDKKKYIKDLTRAMREASRDLDFESAAKLRDLIATLD
ncbi:excinuclease ABC subunit UvrB [Candidatus Gottesmanbacteria bacterium]|nr:excinuclease ABC subunit UvrB [Candidatus Gottesmanbacteria bacterium]